jgi:hypothetical protein
VLNLHKSSSGANLGNLAILQAQIHHQACLLLFSSIGGVNKPDDSVLAPAFIDKSVFHGIFVTSSSVCDELVLGLALSGARPVGPQTPRYTTGSFAYLCRLRCELGTIRLTSYQANNEQGESVPLQP